MTIQEMARIYKRICKVYHAGYCEGCPLIARNFTDATDCLNAIILHPDEYEKALLDWAKENPAPTNRHKFLEVFGISYYPPEDGDWWDEEYVEPERKEE